MIGTLTLIPASHWDGDLVSMDSSYPESEVSYLSRNYGSDHMKQLTDGHLIKAFGRYCLPSKRSEILSIIQRIPTLKCENVPDLKPGRAATNRQQLTEVLQLFEKPSTRSLRWNQHYREALLLVQRDVVGLICSDNGPEYLKPMAIEDVALSDAFQKNLDKHAGFVAFETGLRSKGENLDYCVQWCNEHRDEILKRGHYGIPVVLAHRSSNSKISDWSEGYWKERCRPISIKDTRDQLMDGRFAIPFNEAFTNIYWGEGGMSHEEVRDWVTSKRFNYERFYSSDYSKFDSSQSDWLIEDAFYQVIRPTFGVLSDEDENLFRIMVTSYIHKNIHSFDRVYRCHKGNVSGSLLTYTINTIINQIVDVTCLLMQGCDPKKFISLKCGDDNLTYYKADQKFDMKKHCELISRYFGIKTTYDENSIGDSQKDPDFLSRQWGLDGARRHIEEVIWNGMYPEKFRDYYASGLALERAIALNLYCMVMDQPATMREYFDVDSIKRVAGIQYESSADIIRKVIAMGTGFATRKWQFYLSTGLGKPKSSIKRYPTHLRAIA